MRPAAILLLASLAPALAGCVDPEAASEPSGTPVTFARVESGPQTSYRTADRQLFVLDTSPEWEDFWQRHIGADGPRAPPVDFSKRFVLGLLMGERQTGGYEIQVTSVSLNEGKYAAVYEEHRPGACPATDAVTYPFDIVSVTRATAGTPDVVFRAAEAKEQSC